MALIVFFFLNQRHLVNQTKFTQVIKLMGPVV